MRLSMLNFSLSTIVGTRIELFYSDVSKCRVVTSVGFIIGNFFSHSVKIEVTMLEFIFYIKYQEIINRSSALFVDGDEEKTIN